VAGQAHTVFGAQQSRVTTSVTRDKPDGCPRVINAIFVSDCGAPSTTRTCHDLRAPLRALDGFSDELLRCYADRLDDRGQHYLRRLRSGTQRMGQLIDDMLQLSRLNRGEMKRESVDLTALAEAVAAELRGREPDRK
jgi:signal transduction histidine kinase